MTLVVTSADIRDFCPVSSSDAVIESIICSVQAGIGDCLESSYPECTALTIFKAVVCHLLSSVEGGEVTTERAPNGAATTFANNGSGEGLKSSEMGRLALSLDKNNCTDAMFTSTLLFLAGGNSEAPESW